MFPSCDYEIKSSPNVTLEMAVSRRESMKREKDHDTRCFGAGCWVQPGTMSGDGHFEALRPVWLCRSMHRLGNVGLYVIYLNFDIVYSFFDNVTFTDELGQARGWLGESDNDVSEESESLESELMTLWRPVVSKGFGWCPLP